MRSIVAPLLSALVLTVLVCTPAQAAHIVNRHHFATVNQSLAKRYDGSRFSYYDVTTGEVACGGWHKNSEFVVALTTEQWDDGAHCGKQIEMSWQGKTTTATIVDRCMGCPYAGLDLTSDLFIYFAGSTDPGFLWEGSWNYAGQAPTTSKPPPPTSTTPPPPPPPSTTSSTHEATPTTTSSTHSRSSSTRARPTTTTSSSAETTTSSRPVVTSSSSISVVVTSSSSSSVSLSSTSSVTSAAPTSTPTKRSTISDLLLVYAQIAALDAAAVGGKT